MEFHTDPHSDLFCLPPNDLSIWIVDGLFLRVQAQREQDDPSVRLLPHVQPNQVSVGPTIAATPQQAPALTSDLLQNHLEICCIHANILDFYLNNVLPHHSSNNAHTQRLQTDLGRISRDLETHGCVSVLLLLLRVSLAVLASRRAPRFGSNGSVASIFSFDLTLTFKTFLPPSGFSQSSMT